MIGTAPGEVVHLAGIADQPAQQAWPAGGLIVAGTAEQAIVAAPSLATQNADITKEKVPVGPAEQPVVAASSFDLIAAARAGEHIVPMIADDPGHRAHPLATARLAPSAGRASQGAPGARHTQP